MRGPMPAALDSGVCDTHPQGCCSSGIQQLSSAEDIGMPSLQWLRMNKCKQLRRLPIKGMTSMIGLQTLEMCQCVPGLSSLMSCNCK